MNPRVTAIAAACLALLGSRPTQANGRFPLVDQLVVNPDDPDQLVLRGTFGLVVSRDRGASWDWLCEPGMGYKDIVPPLAILPSGVLLLALPTGISRSDASWCSFAPAAGIEGLVVDVSAVLSEPGTAIALSIDLEARTSRIWESTDDGATWHALGAPIDDFQATTLDAAAADPNVIYVSGITTGTADDLLLRSDDRGASWQRHPVTASSTLPVASMAYIGAVDPASADTVYVRMYGAPGRVLVTRDGGETFEEILSMSGLVNSFALSPDGATLLAGNLSEGIYRADTASLDVERLACSGVTCLSWNEGGLYACGDINLNRFLVGKSPDGGASFEVLLAPSCIRGPLACEKATSIGSGCPELWAFEQTRLGATCAPAAAAPLDYGCLATGGTAGSGTGGVAGAAGTEASGGGIPGSGSSASSGAGDGSSDPRDAGEATASTEDEIAAKDRPHAGNRGCGCSLPPAGGRLWGVACLSALLILGRRLRRRSSDF